MPESWYLDMLIGLQELVIKLQDHVLKLQERNRKLEERVDAVETERGQGPYQEGEFGDIAKAMVGRG